MAAKVASGTIRVLNHSRGQADASSIARNGRFNSRARGGPVRNRVRRLQRRRTSRKIERGQESDRAERLSGRRPQARGTSGVCSADREQLKIHGLNASYLQGLAAASFGAIESARVLSVPPASGCTNTVGHEPPCIVRFFGSVSGLSTASSAADDVLSLSPDQYTRIRGLAVEATGPPGGSSVSVGVSYMDTAGVHVVSECGISSVLTTCVQALGLKVIPPGSPICVEIDEYYGVGVSVPSESVLVGFRMSPS